MAGRDLGASLSLAREMGPERSADPAPGRTLANWPSLGPLPRHSWVTTGPPCPWAQSALPVRARQGGLSSSADGKAATQRGKGTAPRPHSHAGGLRLHVQPPHADMASPSEPGVGSGPGVPRLHLEGFLGVTDSEQGQQQSPGPVACSDVCLLPEAGACTAARPKQPSQGREAGSAGLCLARVGGILVLTPFCCSGRFGGPRSLQHQLQSPITSHSAHLLPSGCQDFFNIPEREGGTMTLRAPHSSCNSALEGTQGQA